jgi:hypothetical protein
MNEITKNSEKEKVAVRRQQTKLKVEITRGVWFIFYTKNNFGAALRLKNATRRHVLFAPLGVLIFAAQRQDVALEKST